MRSDLHQVTLYVECAVEDSQNIYIVVWFDQVGDPVVTVMKNPDFPRADSLVLMPDAGMVCE